MSRRLRHASGRATSAERIPRYLQVASALRARIRQGRLPVGTQIATIDELECEFDVARITVRQAIVLLASEGLIKSVQGKGTFVIAMPADDRWLQLATDWESLIRPIRGNVPQNLVVVESGPPRLAAAEGHPAAEYRFLTSTQTRRRAPFALARVHIASPIYALAPGQFARQPALSVISEMAGLAIGRAHQTLTIGTADIEAARALKCALNAPTVEARCVVTDHDGVVIYLGEITYRGDCVRLNIELKSRNWAGFDSI